MYVLPRKALAYDIQFTCDNSNCNITSDNTKLFNETNIYPNWTTTKVLQVVNTSSTTNTFGIKLASSGFLTSFAKFPDELAITITKSSDSSHIYGPKTFSEWKADDYVTLGAVESYSTQDFDFAVAFADVGNDFRGSILSFDLALGIEHGTKSTKQPSGGTDNDDDDEDDRDTDAVIQSVQGVMIHAPSDLTRLQEPITYASEAVVVDPVVEDLTGAYSIAGAATCKDPFWWPLLYILAIFAHLVVSGLRLKKVPAKTLQLGVALVFVYVFLKYFCPWWDFIPSVVLGLVFLLVPKTS